MTVYVIMFFSSSKMLPYGHSLTQLCLVVFWGTAVREHMLLQLGAAGPLLLQAIPGKNPGLSQPAQAQGKPAYLSGRSVPQYRKPEEKSGCHPPKEVHYETAERKW